jgi:general secretion pathway protein B
MAPVSAPAPDRDDAPDAQPAAAEAASNDAGPVTPDRRAPPPDRPPQPTRTAAAIPTTQATTPAQRPLRAALSPPQKDLAAPTEPTLTRLRDDAVKLQAVAWSSDPERRMAVINEQVVREGYTIEGYTIATIREESVIVRKGAESWELRYGH